MSAFWLYLVASLLFGATAALEFWRGDSGAVWVTLAALFLILGVEARKPSRKAQ